MAKAKSKAANTEVVPVSPTPVQPTAAPKRYLVKVQFAFKGDMNNRYLPGADVSHLDTQRLDKLIQKGLVTHDE